MKESDIMGVLDEGAAADDEGRRLTGPADEQNS